MHVLLRMVTTLICFELVMSPVQGGFISSALAEDCAAGMVYNSSLNRCLTTNEVASVNRATEVCRTTSQNETDADKKTQNQQNCYKQNALNALSGKAPGPGKDNIADPNPLKIAGTAAAVAIPLLMFIKGAERRKKNGGARCSAPSSILMYSGAAALIMGEVITYVWLNKKLKKAKNKWKEIVTPGATASEDKKRELATEAQSQAFEYLAQNEEAIANVAKTKFGFYMTATGLFAAGSLVAVLEMIKPGTMTTFCPPSKDSAPTSGGASGGTTAAGTSSGGTSSPNSFTDGGANEGGTGGGTNAPSGNTSSSKSFTDGGANEGGTGGGTKAPSSGTSSPKSFTDGGANEGGGTGASINFKNSKLKQVALKNISTAENAAQLMALLSEYESIEFENYSRTLYLDEDSNKELVKIPLDRTISGLVSSLLIQESMAQNPGYITPTDDPNVVKTPIGYVAKEYVYKKPVEDIASKVTVEDIVEEVVAPTPGADIETLNVKATNVKAANSAVDKVFAKLDRPLGRLAVNTLLGTWMGIMSGQMKKQQKISEERAEKLRQMKEEFNSQAGILSCTEKDRSDPAKPSCYCFTSENKKNPNRTNSTVCNTAYVGLTSTGTSALASTTTACLDTSYGVDPSCSCKSRVDSTGKNSCAKIGSGLSVTGVTPGVFKMLSVAAAPANDLANGKTSIGSMDTGSIGSNAARIKKASDDLLAKTNPKLASEAEKTAKDMETALAKGTSGLSMSSPSDSSSMPSSPQQAVAELEKELNLDKITPQVKTSGSGAAAAIPEGQNLEFGLSADQAAIQEAQVAEALKQDVDFGENDITKASDTNIFEVLSHRYQRSGMRRLFDEDGKTQADKPSKTDINK